MFCTPTNKSRQISHFPNSYQLLLRCLLLAGRFYRVRFASLSGHVTHQHMPVECIGASLVARARAYSSYSRRLSQSRYMGRRRCSLWRRPWYAWYVYGRKTDDGKFKTIFTCNRLVGYNCYFMVAYETVRELRNRRSRCLCPVAATAIKNPERIEMSTGLHRSQPNRMNKLSRFSSRFIELFHQMGAFRYLPVLNWIRLDGRTYVWQLDNPDMFPFFLRHLIRILLLGHSINELCGGAWGLKLAI